MTGDDETTRGGRAGGSHRPANTESARAGPSGGSDSRRVLVVGGEERPLSTVRTALEGAGVAVVGVETAPEVLSAVRDGSYDCVVSPVAAGELDGLQLLRRARRELPSVSTVLLVGAADVDAVNRAGAAGFDAVLTEAATATQVVETVWQVTADRRVAGDRTRWRGFLVALHDAIAATFDVGPGATVERAVCERLVSADVCTVAWVSRYEPETGRLLPETAVGVTPTTLADRPVPPDLDWAAGPVVDDGEERTATLPLVVGGEPYGTVHLVLSRPLDEAERDLLGRFGAVLSGRLDGSTDDDASSTDEGLLERFSGIIGHELRNHVQAMELTLDLARSDGAESLDKVEEILDRVDRLADDASTVAEASVDRDELSTRDLGTTATVAWERLESGEATLAVESSVPVRADHDVLELLFENLFRNSVEHGSTGSGSQAHRDAAVQSERGLDVHVGMLPGGDGFYVEDSGSGIPPERRDEVFGWGVSAGGGTGFGLAIVERIATAHGWTVEVTDGASGGARFEFRGVSS